MVVQTIARLRLKRPSLGVDHVEERTKLGEAERTVVDVAPAFGEPGHLDRLRANALLFVRIFQRETEAERLVARLDEGILRARA